MKSPTASPRCSPSAGCNAVVVPLQIAAGRPRRAAHRPHPVRRASPGSSPPCRTSSASPRTAPRSPTGPASSARSTSPAATRTARGTATRSTARPSSPPSGPGGDPEGAAALQVGAGGAGSAIALALLEAGVAELRPARRRPGPPRRPGRTAARALRRPRAGGRRRPDRRRPRRQRHPDGHAGRRPLPGRRHAAQAGHRSSATSSPSPRCRR